MLTLNRYHFREPECVILMPYLYLFSIVSRMRGRVHNKCMSDHVRIDFLLIETVI